VVDPKKPQIILETRYSPYDLAKVVLGEHILDVFQISYINPDDVILISNLLKY